jgi:hypothetical protein
MHNELGRLVKGDNFSAKKTLDNTCDLMHGEAAEEQ